ncbi:hypothetical protein AGMMS49944_17730 [Spirochaetia bacterium]|nr:hypothetical protein AGMMS49944_17730 [Spirochaetia bacterium]
MLHIVINRWVDIQKFLEFVNYQGKGLPDGEVHKILKQDLETVDAFGYKDIERLGNSIRECSVNVSSRIRFSSSISFVRL